MANKTLEDLAAQVEKNVSVENSAAVVINGISARVQAAVDAAIAGGASKEDLAPVQAEIDALAASSKALAVAVEANTVPATPAG